MLRGVRTFKNKAATAAKAAQQAARDQKASQGRDPYGLFKEAIASVPDPSVPRMSSRLSQTEWKAHRAQYSREKMLEVRRRPIAGPVLITHRPNCALVLAASSRERSPDRDDQAAQCGAPAESSVGTDAKCC